jgi:hypothetical protein
VEIVGCGVCVEMSGGRVRGKRGGGGGGGGNPCCTFFLHALGHNCAWLYECGKLSCSRQEGIAVWFPSKRFRFCLASSDPLKN